ncbi:hypothetical protein DL96DRAFT_1717555 [Flagelloscypha sp. PMI_526]|nr:hypothetical protein DL96DRAFT_1717555 [Flagelloscypha sp. PMI_526]
MVPLVHGWAFTAVPSGECGPVAVTWAGGSQPFTVTLHPIDSVSIPYSVPASAFQNGQGSYSFTLPVAAGKQFVITMGDSTGQLSGGASQVFTTDARQAANSACSTTAPPNDFFWTAPEDNLHQCQSYPFTDIGTDSNAKIQRPTTLLVIIPGGGGSFTVPMTGSGSFDWTANVAAGTPVLFDMTDAAGNQGGNDVKIRAVGTGSGSCSVHSAVAASSEPVSTPTSSATATGTTTNSKSATSAASTAPPSSTPAAASFSTGAIAGIAVGGAVLLGLLAVFLFLLCRRRRRREQEDSDGSKDFLGPLPASPFQDRHQPTGALAAYSHSSSPSLSSTSPSGRTTMYHTVAMPPNMMNTDIADIQPLDLQPQRPYSGPAELDGGGNAWIVGTNGTTLAYRQGGTSPTPSGNSMNAYAYRQAGSPIQSGNLGSITESKGRGPGTSSPNPSGTGPSPAASSAKLVKKNPSASGSNIENQWLSDLKNSAGGSGGKF